MRRVVTVAWLLGLVATAGGAQDALPPEQCLAPAGQTSALTIEHGGKTYRMANEACRAQFAADPERYSQLYDALLELEAEGTPLRAPETPSLVPS